MVSQYLDKILKHKRYIKTGFNIQGKFILNGVVVEKRVVVNINKQEVTAYLFDNDSVSIYIMCTEIKQLGEIYLLILDYTNKNKERVYNSIIKHSISCEWERYLTTLI